MLLKKIKSEGLAHLSYIIGSEGQAAVVDPRRDCQIYLDLAQENNMDIFFILETHRNEDYVSGSRELQAMTGAKVLHGDLDFNYGERVWDGQEIRLGMLTLRAIETPGHTPESMCYSVVDNEAGPEVVAVFTGDTLLVGEAGRTDLFGPERREILSSLQYDSLFDRLLPLGDGVIILPAHGAGSSCGNNIGSREYSTIGLERMQNHALMVGGKEEFIDLKLGEFLEKPPYFEQMERLNLEGAPLIGSLPRAFPVPSKEAWAMIETMVLLDLRSPSAHASSHIPGAISLPMDILPNYGGWVIPYGPPIILILDRSSQLDTAIRTLVRIGYDNIAGYISGGMESWHKAALPTSSFEALSIRELLERPDHGHLFYLDIRAEKEWRVGHANGARHIFVGHLEDRIDETPVDRETVILCSSGTRGSLAASLLEKHGRAPINLLGGMAGWKEAGLPIDRSSR